MRASSRDAGARQARLESLQQRLAESVGALVTSEEWKRALEFAARFRARSAGRIGVFEVREYPNPDQT